MHKFRQLYIGKRVWKTAISVYITAMVCHTLNWPVIFAVIAAIVTVEPTVSASIKKGMIRLPAALIGAGIAMFFDFLLGQVPLAYTLSALFTIYVCHLLKWHDAILVATLTAVVMISMTDDNFLSAFVVRSGTTMIGIVVSTLVNVLVWPPDFKEEIINTYHAKLRDIQVLTADTLSYIWGAPHTKTLLEYRFSTLSKGIERLTELIFYEREEQRFRWNAVVKTSGEEINDWQNNANQVRQLSFHVGDLLSLVSGSQKISNEDKEILAEAWACIEKMFKQISQVETEQQKTEQQKTEQQKTEQQKTEQQKTEQQKTEQQKTEQQETVELTESTQPISGLYHILHTYTDNRYSHQELPLAASIAYQLLAIYHILVELQQDSLKRA